MGSERLRSQSCEPDKVVCTGAQSCEPEEVVCTGAQSCESEEVVCTGAQCCELEEVVCTGAQCCELEEVVCTGAQSCEPESYKLNFPPPTWLEAVFFPLPWSHARYTPHSIAVCWLLLTWFGPHPPQWSVFFILLWYLLGWIPAAGGCSYRYSWVGTVS